MSIQESGIEYLPDNTKERLPEVLNVLTILTYIGCVLGLIFTLWGYLDAKTYYDNEVERQAAISLSPAWAKKLVGDETVEIARRTYENRLYIFLFGLAGIFLCFWGAQLMRKLQKRGFTIWLIGELFPTASILIFVGAIAYERLASLLSLLFPIAFIIVYSRQRKYLK